ncbi:anti-sigma-D factor RsdA [Mycobacterium kubicae]|uniref:anti-sigma-D factor RsdA n=1 Tax=Mycobacterium kubicae TaxID=120959 RepID=UPI003CC82839
MRQVTMPEFDPRLDELARTDLLLDALAERDDFRLDDPNDDALAALLGEWRDDLRWPPASALVSQDEAEAALLAGMAERRRSRRGVTAVGSVAASVLLLSGFGAVVADARPGDLLYGLHAMMFNEPRVSDDQIELSAKADLAKVEQMIAQGQWAQAQTQLAEVSTSVQSVNDGSRRQFLLDEVNQLNTKVEKHDPNATAPLAPTPESTPLTTTSPPRASTTVPSTPTVTPTTQPTLTPTTTPHTTATTPPTTSATDTPTTTSKHRHRHGSTSTTAPESPAP